MVDWRTDRAGVVDDRVVLPVVAGVAERAARVAWAGAGHRGATMGDWVTDRAGVDDHVVQTMAGYAIAALRVECRHASDKRGAGIDGRARDARGAAESVGEVVAVLAGGALRVDGAGARHRGGDTMVDWRTDRTGVDDPVVQPMAGY